MNDRATENNPIVVFRERDPEEYKTEHTVKRYADDYLLSQIGRRFGSTRLRTDFVFTKDAHIMFLEYIYHHVDVSKYATEDELIKAVEKTDAIKILMKEARARLKKNIVRALNIRVYKTAVFFNSCVACFFLGTIAHAIVF